MNFLNWKLILITGLIFGSCSTEPQPIEYHADQCAECKMMISDQRFGAELVTKKGKIFKYDAAECLVRAVKVKGESEFAHIMVTDFKSPTQLIDATSATYLISELRPSPMGANLSAYKEKNQIDDSLIQENAEILDWKQILANF
jgi:copper chaperone NosL